MLAVGVKVGAYFDLATGSKTATKWYTGTVEACTAGKYTVRYSDGETMTYALKDFLPGPRAPWEEQRAHPCLIAPSSATADVIATAHQAQGGSIRPRGSGASGAGQARLAAAVTPVGGKKEVQERRGGRLAFTMPVSSKHGYNHPVRVAMSVVTPVRMTMADDGVYLLHRDDEAYTSAYVQRCSAAQQHGSEGIEREPTDFAARKSQFQPRGTW